jgi:hypothetical protein
MSKRQNPGPKLAEFLARLGNVQEDSNGWNARCPHHDDQKNSLSIAIGKDEVTVLKCHAECKTHDVVYAVGMSMTDLFPERYGEPKNKKRKRGKVVKAYDYCDEFGALRYQVCRMEPKDFRQRRPDGKDGWVWNMKGITKIPYRLPELIEAEKSKPVFIVEGEKDVDRLAELGLVATCNPGGAGKWMKSMSKYLEGRGVVLVQDNDQAGLEHVADTGKKLAGIAKSIKTILLPDLPKHGDVSDWLDAGGAAGDLLAISDAAEDGVPDAPSPAEIRRIVSTNDLDCICNSILDEDRVIPVCMESIISKIREVTDDWPRRVGNDLFFHNVHGVHWLEKPPDLFSMLGENREPPIFREKFNCHSKHEVFSFLRRVATKYESVESFPHEPQLSTCYYTCEQPEPGDGKVLAGLVDRFCPETEHDSELIKAMFATTIWGGVGGSRPAFVITSDQGRGTGKSKMAAMVGFLTGGVIGLSASETSEAVKHRLLSPEGLSKRVALLDNVKSLRFSWAELESLITDTVISGKRMYVGEASRPNTLTWVITLNGISLSTDMAQRAVVIKISRPTHSGDWEESMRSYIDENRDALLSDLVAFLRLPAAPMPRYSRWGTWEKQVLSKLKNPALLQEVIQERIGESDVENDEAEEIESFFQKSIHSLGYYPEERVHVPSTIAAKWVYKATGDRHTTVAIGRMLSQKIKEESVTLLSKNPSHTYGRGFVFCAAPTENLEKIKYDLESRIEVNNRNELK